MCRDYSDWVELLYEMVRDCIEQIGNQMCGDKSHEGDAPFIRLNNHLELDVIDTTPEMKMRALVSASMMNGFKLSDEQKY